MFQRTVGVIGPVECGATNNNCFYLSIIEGMEWQINGKFGKLIPHAGREASLTVGNTSYGPEELKILVTEFLINDGECKKFRENAPDIALNLGFCDQYTLDNQTWCIYNSCYGMSHVTGHPVLCYGNVNSAFNEESFHTVYCCRPEDGPPGKEFGIGVGNRVTRDGYLKYQETAYRIILGFGREEYLIKVMGLAHESEEHRNARGDLTSELSNMGMNNPLYKKCFELGHAVAEENMLFVTRAMLCAIGVNYDGYLEKLNALIEEEIEKFLAFVEGLKRRGIAPLCVEHDGKIHYQAMLTLPIQPDVQLEDDILKKTGVAPLRFGGQPCRMFAGQSVPKWKCFLNEAQKQFLKTHRLSPVSRTDDFGCRSMFYKVVGAVGPFDRGAESNNCFFHSIILALCWQGDPKFIIDSKLIINNRHHTPAMMRNEVFNFLKSDGECLRFHAKNPNLAGRVGFYKNYDEQQESCVEAHSACYAMSHMSGQPVLCYRAGSSRDVPLYHVVFCSLPDEGPPGREFALGMGKMVARENYDEFKRRKYEGMVSDGIRKSFRMEHGPNADDDTDLNDRIVELCDEFNSGDGNRSEYERYLRLGQQEWERDVLFDLRSNALVIGADYDRFLERVRDKIAEEREKFIGFVDGLRNRGIAPLCVEHDGTNHFLAVLTLPDGLVWDGAYSIRQRIPLPPYDQPQGIFAGRTPPRWNRPLSQRQREFLQNASIPPMASMDFPDGLGFFQRTIGAIGPFECGAYRNNCAFLSAMAGLRWQSAELGQPILQQAERSAVILNKVSYKSDALRFHLFDLLSNDEKCREFALKDVSAAGTLQFGSYEIEMIRNSAQNGNALSSMVTYASACYTLSLGTGQPVLCYGYAFPDSQNLMTIRCAFCSIPGEKPPGREFIFSIDKMFPRQDYAYRKKKASSIIFENGKHRWVENQYGHNQDLMGDQSVALNEELQRTGETHPLLSTFLQLGRCECEQSPLSVKRIEVAIADSRDYDDCVNRLNNLVARDRANFVELVEALKLRGVAPLCLLKLNEQLHFHALLPLPLGLSEDEMKLIEEKTRART
ncbi:MAG: hypothetical protein LBT98_04305 [Puniceicoccales bacterium]|jgi:hypothetical protein|nr:hypothetical protein [Puniceicoccales bacterium]